jgi:hypothetical protein
MTWAEFKKTWSRYTGKESSAYQEHFNDLCRLLGQPTPAEADPTGKDLAVEVREYFIPDFPNWKDHDAFEKSFARLLRDLKASEVKRA